MSQHRALFNIDVLYEIFGHLSSNSSNRSTLASAALTCRAFSEPASVVLWSSLPHQCGILPLLRTFSGLTEYRKESTFIGRPCTFTTYTVNDNAVSEPEWSRFQQLASRIRYLSYSDLELDPSLVALLTARCNGDPLIPNLQTLIWPLSEDDEERRKILRILCPTRTLSQLYIHNRRYRPRARGPVFMSNDLDIIITSPNLQFIHIDAHAVRLDTSAEQTRPEHLRSLTSLRDISLCYPFPPTAGFIYELGGLPRLERVCLSGGGSDWEKPSWRVFDGFPALQKLDLRHPSCDFALFLLSSVTSTRLTTLRLSSSLSPSNPQLSTLISALWCGCLSPLRRLSLFILRKSNDGQGPTEAAAMDFVAPLLRLSSLEALSLVVDLPVAHPLTDDDVNRMRDAWPNLVLLTITYETDDSASPTADSIIRCPSLGAIVGLAAFCSRLEYLRLHCRSVSEADVAYLENFAAAYGQVQQALLDTIVFAHDRTYTRLAIHDVHRVARALYCLFPNLRAPQLEGGWEKHSWFMGRQKPVYESDAYRLFVAFQEIQPLTPVKRDPERLLVW